MLAGTVEHGDSMGNRGSIGAGDIQWMTAGRGIIHQEMPTGDAAGRMHGFQLWANLPSPLKMTAPRYQDVKVENPRVRRLGLAPSGEKWANMCPVGATFAEVVNEYRVRIAGLPIQSAFALYDARRNKIVLTALFDEINHKAEDELAKIDAYMLDSFSADFMLDFRTIHLMGRDAAMFTPPGAWRLTLPRSRHPATD